MPIEFDSAKAASNLKKHGVSFAHTGQALRDPMALTIETRTHAKKRAT
ncbi:MAG TPA: BrnT family toxin [Gammaproteobacteria bacterium]|nr:BrnT family toxin [Gammaproteobacteria bacterium]